MRIFKPALFIFFITFICPASAQAAEFKPGEKYFTVPLAITLEVLSPGEVELMAMGGEKQKASYTTDEAGRVNFVVDKGETTFVVTVSDKGEFIVAHVKRSGGEEIFVPLFSRAAYETMRVAGMVESFEDQMAEMRTRAVTAELQVNLRNAYTSAQVYIMENNPAGPVTVENILSTGFVASTNATLLSSDMTGFGGGIKMKIVVDGVGEATGEIKFDGDMDISTVK